MNTALAYKFESYYTGNGCINIPIDHGRYPLSDELSICEVSENKLYYKNYLNDDITEIILLMQAEFVVI